MYAVSRENASLCEKFDVYISNFGDNNVTEICVMSSSNPVNCLLVIL